MESHKFTNVLLVLVFIALAYLVFTKQHNTRMHGENDAYDYTVGVEGEAEMFVAPDAAKISFSATKKAMNTNAAMGSVNKRMHALMEQLKALGVEEKDIKTIAYTVRPEYSYRDDTERFEGYRASQRVEVTIRDLNSTSEVLDIVHKAELDQVSELTFFVEDTEKIMEDLRAKAIADAKQKAKKLSKDLGVKLDTIVGFYDNTQDDMGVVAYAAMDKAMGGPMKEEFAPTVPKGENHFTVHVTVTYAVE